MQVLAPAKINLSLKILGRRGDGFHEVETLIAPISLYDKIDIEKQNRWIDFSCDDPTLSTGDDNLVVRAAKTDRKSTRLNSSHLVISYAVFCLKKKKFMIGMPRNRQHSTVWYA